MEFYSNWIVRLGIKAHGHPLLGIHGRYVSLPIIHYGKIELLVTFLLDKDSSGLMLGIADSQWKFESNYIGMYFPAKKLGKIE